MHDQELIRKIAEKDPSAFETIVLRYRSLVLNTCRRLLKNPQQAEDAAQDVFLQVYKSAKKFRFESKLSTWIYRITVNRCLSIIRRDKREQWFHNITAVVENESEIESLQPVSAGKTPDKVLEDKENKNILDEALDSLPPNQKAALVLHKYENKSYREVSDILGISLSATEARIHRAKNSLRKNILRRLKNYK
jgi:RNA polymerase sigma-70 factor (ECF subfamily)